MDHDSGWYGYLIARHNIFLILGTALFGLAVISTLTGICLDKYRGIIDRTKDPKMFWQNVAAYYLIGILFFGLYLYTAN
jgi:hypothetical protein